MQDRVKVDNEVVASRLSPLGIYPIVFQPSYNIPLSVFQNQITEYLEQESKKKEAT